jgi:hypothetical protein
MHATRWPSAGIALPGRPMSSARLAAGWDPTVKRPFLVLATTWLVSGTSNSEAEPKDDARCAAIYVLRCTEIAFRGSSAHVPRNQTSGWSTARGSRRSLRDSAGKTIGAFALAAFAAASNHAGFRCFASRRPLSSLGRYDFRLNAGSQPSKCGSPTRDDRTIHIQTNRRNSYVY